MSKRESAPWVSDEAANWGGPTQLSQSRSVCDCTWGIQKTAIRDRDVLALCQRAASLFRTRSSLVV